VQQRDVLTNFSEDLAIVAVADAQVERCPGLVRETHDVRNVGGVRLWPCGSEFNREFGTGLVDVIVEVDVGEEAVHAVEEFGSGPVVDRQCRDGHPSASAELSHREEGLDAARAETEDGLLRVTDHDESGVGDVEEESLEDIPLQRVGVLELVNHNDLEVVSHLGDEAIAPRAREASFQTTDELGEGGHAALGQKRFVAPDDPKCEALLELGEGDPHLLVLLLVVSREDGKGIERPPLGHATTRVVQGSRDLDDGLQCRGLEELVELGG